MMAVTRMGGIPDYTVRRVVHFRTPVAATGQRGAPSNRDRPPLRSARPATALRRCAEPHLTVGREECAHLARFALNRLAHRGRRPAEELHSERGRLRGAFGKPDADDRRAAEDDGRNPALGAIDALVEPPV